MEASVRKPFQGVANIVRFNWHFYALATAACITLYMCRLLFPGIMVINITAGVLLISLATVISLAASYFIYDRSDLYRLGWLNSINMPTAANIVNIHAGFDETSALLASKFPDARITVFDFYDPTKHTEVSVKRARRANPTYPGTVKTGTTNIPLQPGTVDSVFAILAAHEIRNPTERAAFFRSLKQSLKPQGKIVVVEHLRNIPNFIAYNIGFLHFFSKQEWVSTFDAAGLTITQQFRITPFIKAYILV